MRKRILTTSYYFLLVICVNCFAVRVALCQQINEHSISKPLPADFYIPFLHPHTALPDTGIKKNSDVIATAMQLTPAGIFDAIDRVCLAIDGMLVSGMFIKDTAEGPIVAIVKDSSVTNTNTATPYFVAEQTTGQPSNDLAQITAQFKPVINRYARMIEEEPDDLQNFPLYKFIDNWYGTRYRYGGMDNSGIDCSAFSQKLYGNVYGANILRTSRQQHRHCERISLNDAREGDLVFFRIHHVLISHVGVYLANGYFVHASRSHGVVISSLNDRYWHARFAGCGRIEKPERNFTESASYMEDTE